ncbi:uncharacterized protein LOC141590536 [Silene latifolia]|uniref:uncharacterized protein LOC141590536 n=1 Tax=Silene latifolia TaxID=37657 RepID=UPI003D785511
MEENCVMDRILEDFFIYNPNPFLQPQNQTPRSNRYYIERDREQGYEQLFNDYFADDPVYPAHIFRCRFRMQKHVLLRIVEAISTSDDLFGQMPNRSGSCNDINVLQRSPIFNDILEGRVPQVNFAVNGHQYNMGYYLTDGIYLSWSTFVKSITAPQLRKHKLFAQYKEAARKDVERAFGILQARFSFIKRPCHIWNTRIIGKIMMTCIIMHNMIVEDERDTYLNHWDTTGFNEDMSTQRSAINGDEVHDNESLQFSIGDSSLTGYMQHRSQLRDRNTNNDLKSDLIEHVWETFGNAN